MGVKLGAVVVILSRLIKAGLIEKGAWSKDLKEMREIVHSMDVWTENMLRRRENQNQVSRLEVCLM